VVNYTARNERKVVAEIALRQGIEGNQHLKAATPAFPQLKRSIPVLRAARHAPFHWRSRCEERLGQHIAERTGPSAGRIETLSAYRMSRGEGLALELSGWAERDGVAAECVVLADSSGTAIGAGAFITRRPDVEQAAAQSLGLVGWKGVAAMPISLHVCAFALFPGESEPVPLANCQTVPEGAAVP
jgi:hypothetical protein